MTGSRINLALGEPVIVGGNTHGVRVFTTDDTLNKSVPNGELLKFDTVGLDTDGFVPAMRPFDQITPAGARWRLSSAGCARAAAAISQHRWAWGYR